MGLEMSGLRSWLRRKPQPARVRIRTADGEERYIQLSDDARNRWRSAEEAILAGGATVVELLDGEGHILRAQQLVDDDEQLIDGGGGDVAASRAVARDRRELADVLRAYGEALNTSFQRGAQAANTGQEHLVALVEVLTQHLATAIGNLHTVSANLASLLQQDRDEVPAKDRLLESVLGLAAAAKAGLPAAAPDNHNGGGKR
jgi:uncharacterized phage infection (PIP) family protein YhgE